MSRTYPGAGAVSAWSGNRKAGAGRMEIPRATAPSLVDIDLVSEKPFKARNDTVFTIGPEGAGSCVSWTMTGSMTVGTRVMSLLKSMDKLIGPDFEKGLARLKMSAEASAAAG